MYIECVCCCHFSFTPIGFCFPCTNLLNELIIRYFFTILILPQRESVCVLVCSYSLMKQPRIYRSIDRFNGFCFIMENENARFKCVDVYVRVCTWNKCAPIYLYTIYIHIDRHFKLNEGVFLPSFYSFEIYFFFCFCIFYKYYSVGVCFKPQHYRPHNTHFFLNFHYVFK